MAVGASSVSSACACMCCDRPSTLHRQRARAAGSTSAAASPGRHVAEHWALEVALRDASVVVGPLLGQHCCCEPVGVTEAPVFCRLLHWACGALWRLHQWARARRLRAAAAGLARAAPPHLRPDSAAPPLSHRGIAAAARACCSGCEQCRAAGQPYCCGAVGPADGVTVAMLPNYRLWWFGTSSPGRH